MKEVVGGSQIALSRVLEGLGSGVRRRDGEGRSLGLGFRRFWIRIEFRRVGSGRGLSDWVFKILD